MKAVFADMKLLGSPFITAYAGSSHWNKEKYGWLARLVVSYFYVKDTQARLLIVKRLKGVCIGPSTAPSVLAKVLEYGH